MTRSPRLLLVSMLAFAALAGRAAGAAAAPVRFTNFDRNHSTIGFSVPILGGMSVVDGKFTKFSATIVYDPDAPTASTVTAVIDAATIDTGIPERDRHLRSADFFDVAEHPEIRFTSSRIEERDGGLVAIGTLAMRGVERQIELPFEIKGMRADPASGRVLLGVGAATSLDRRDWGITWEHPDPLFVGDDVRVDIRLISKLTALPDETSGDGNDSSR